MRTGIRRVVPPVIAGVAAAVVMFALGVGAGPLPALGPALTSARGVWGAAANAALPHGQALTIPGLTGTVHVAYSPQGVASVQAANDHDLFLAQGYVTASFRLSEMDLERRFGEGRLAELNGPSSVDSDTFELQLGLLRTARAQWAAMPASSLAAEALVAYAQGVNALIGERRRAHQLPALYGLTGAGVRDWTPVDSLVVQELLTQQLDFDTYPLDQAILARSLGGATAAAWFPVQPATSAPPYDPGPYHYDGVAPIPVTSANAARPAATTAAVAQADGAVPADATAQAAAAILARVAALPAGAAHLHSDSNSWAVNGPSAQGGAALLAGDPHLHLSLPSDWYEISLLSPDLDVTGASIPGAPAVLLGHNAHISWSLTDVQNQSTLYYTEQTSPAHPGQYFWRGAWRPYQRVHYAIPVRGAATVQLDVDLTVHGPVITQLGQTTSVDWMGDLPSPDIEVLLKINAASDWSRFTGALADWRAPTQNFAYADDQGNIGITTAGVFPLVSDGRGAPPGSASTQRPGAMPWLPLDGTGAADVSGMIPVADIPRVYDPPAHVVATANQRPAGAGYPYYIGPAQGYDPGYRARQIYATLTAGGAVSQAGMAALQANLTDGLAQEIVPELLTALDGASLDPTARSAAQMLAGWNESMDASSPVATIWWAFWSQYLSQVFQPWWTKGKVPVHLDPDNLALASQPGPLQQDLELWTLHEPANPAFTPPGGTAGDAPSAMRKAFARAVASLAKSLRGAPGTWTWGRVHSRVIPSLTGAGSLGYGPYPAGGDPRTVNAADNGLQSDFGPSWRMVITWTGPGAATGEAIYPGGQSEDPSSPWYDNLVGPWRNGRYLPLLSGRDPRPGGVAWTLRPGG
jgi:penicillin G amidase